MKAKGGMHGWSVKHEHHHKTRRRKFSPMREQVQVKKAIDRGFDYFFRHNGRTPVNSSWRNAAKGSYGGIIALLSWLRTLESNGYQIFPRQDDTHRPRMA